MKNLALTNANGALLLAIGLVAGDAHAGWVQDLCKKHPTPTVCVATICVNAPGVCGVRVTGGSNNDTAASSPGSSDLPSLQNPNSNNGINHREWQEAIEAAKNQRGWSKSERDAHRTMADLLAVPKQVPAAAAAYGHPKASEYQIDAIRNKIDGMTNQPTVPNAKTTIQQQRQLAPANSQK